jgi:hypothetical protein
LKKTALIIDDCSDEILKSYKNVHIESGEYAWGGDFEEEYILPGHNESSTARIASSRFDYKLDADGELGTTGIFWEGYDLSNID